MGESTGGAISSKSCWLGRCWQRQPLLFGASHERTQTRSAAVPPFLGRHRPMTVGRMQITADCDKIDAKPRRCSPFACPGAGNKSAKSTCGGGRLGATAQEMTLLNQEYAAVPGELKRSCCSEGARVAAVPPCAEEMVVFRASCSFFSPLPAPLRHCKAIS